MWKLSVLLIFALFQTYFNAEVTSEDKDGDKHSVYSHLTELKDEMNRKFKDLAQTRLTDNEILERRFERLRSEFSSVLHLVPKVETLLQNNSLQETAINLLKEKNSLQELLINSLKENNTQQETALNSLKENNDLQFRAINSLKESNVLQESTIGLLKANPVPVGFIYIQLPNQPEPSVLVSVVKWIEITKEYAGLFFRAEGGDSLKFGELQGDNSPRLDHVNGGWYDKLNRTREDAVRIGGTVLETDSWSGLVYAGHMYMPSVAAGTFTHYDGLRFHLTGGETRPKNKAVRIWKRVQ